jgi:hypothetical protein
MMRLLPAVLCLLGLAFPAAAQSVSIDLGAAGQPGATSRLVQLTALVGVLSLAPSLLVMATAFARIAIVLSLLRTAIGAQGVPPNPVVVGLALFLTLLVLAWRGMRRAAAIAAEHDDSFMAGASRALAISLAGFALASVFLSTETDRVLWVLLGLGAVLPRVAAEAASDGAEPAPTVGSVDASPGAAGVEPPMRERHRNA